MEKDLSGVLFPNNKTNEKQPDYRGNVVVGGVKYQVSAWSRTSKMSGMNYMSLSLQIDTRKIIAKPVQHTPQEQVEQVASAVGGVTEFNQNKRNEDVPF